MESRAPTALPTEGVQVADDLEAGHGLTVLGQVDPLEQEKLPAVHS